MTDPIGTAQEPVEQFLDEYCSGHPHLKPYLEERRRERRPKPSTAELVLDCFRKAVSQ